MARINNLTNFLTDVSSAIKQKTGDSTPIPASEFDTEILSIETAGNYQEKSLSITENGNYNLLPDTGYDALSNARISVNVEGGGGTDTSDATATENDLIYPKTAYARGQKLTGTIVPTYINVGGSINQTNFSQGSNGQGAITSDGKAVILWLGTTIYTYVLNDNTNEYEFKHSYTESQLAITGSNDYNNYLIDISGYLENRICRVAFHRYQNVAVCVTFNADTGELLYTGENDEYSAYLTWPGNSSSGRPWDRYLEPIDALTFNRDNPRVLYMSYDNGYYSSYTTSSIINDKTWSFGSNLGIGRNTNIDMISTEDFFIEGNTLYKLSGNKQSISSSSSFGVNASINPSKTLAVSDAKLYNCLYDGTTYYLGTEISTDTIIKTGRGKWLSEYFYAVINDSVLYIYNFVNPNETLVYNYNDVNAMTTKHTGPTLCTSTSSNCFVLKIIGGDVLSTLTMPDNTILRNPIKANFEASDLLINKKAYGQSGLVTGTYVPLDTSDATATASDIILNKTAYVNGEKLIGTYEGKTINLQAKTATPTTSQQIITPSSAYDGLSQVTILPVNNTIDGNITALNIKSGVTILGVTGTYGGGSNIVWPDGVKFIQSTWTSLPGEFAGSDWSNVTDLASMFYRNAKLTNVTIQMNTSNATTAQSMFDGCTKLTTVSSLDTSNVSNMRRMFGNCPALTSIPALDTSNSTNMESMFYSCRVLATMPLLDTSNVTGMQAMFTGCLALSNESLNNILAMCINATSYTGTKTLAYIGLSSAQATTCQGLSNYQDFINAGWTTGY